MLSPKGFRVATASSGEEALDVLSKEHPDLVLLDILMPGMDGYEVCRRIREDPETAFLPVIMITASGGQKKIRAIESGADDFVNKPFDQAELLARVRSLVRVKRYHDTIENQAAELSAWNRELEQRVRDQIEQLERVGRLRRFLPQQLADLIISSGDESFLNAHRRQITVVCCDLRGFTAFAETAEPEDVWEILGEYNGAMGISSAGSKGPWSGSPAMGSWSFSTIPSRATTHRCGRSGWRWRCASGCRNWQTDGSVAVMSWPSGWASLRAMPHSDGSAIPTASSTPQWGASPTWQHACVLRRRPGRSSSPSA